MYQNVDRRAVKEAIEDVIVHIRALKKRQREPHQPNFGALDYRDLRQLKLRATLLCSIRAAMRGKLHHLKTLMEQHAFIVPALNEFERRAEAA